MGKVCEGERQDRGGGEGKKDMGKWKMRKGEELNRYVK